MKLANGRLTIKLVNVKGLKYSQQGTPVWMATGILRHRTKEGKGWVDTPGSPTMWLRVVAFGELAEELGDANLGKNSYIMAHNADFKPLMPNEDGSLVMQVIIYGKVDYEGSEEDQGGDAPF